MMKKLLLTIVAVLSVFAANAYPDSIENTSVKAISKSYAEVSDSVIDRMDIITANTDSIRTQIANVDKNTRVKEIFGYEIDDINLMLAIAALVLAGLTWKEQKKTSDSVVRASYNAQKGVFAGLVRHLYRNLVATLAFSRKLLENNAYKDYYPSEEHLLKLEMPFEGLQLENYNDNPDLYKKVHGLKLVFRNYNIEADIAMTHLKNSSPDKDVMMADLGTLIFKPLFLVYKILEVTSQMVTLWEKNGKKSDAYKNILSTMICEHIKKAAKWEEGKFATDSYINLKDKVIKEEGAQKGKNLYGELRRSWKMLAYDEEDKLKKVPGFVNPILPDISDDDFKKYCAVLNRIEGINDIQVIKDMSEKFKTSSSKDSAFDYETYFFIMLSIDVTKELEKMHLIKRS